MPVHASCGALVRRAAIVTAVVVSAQAAVTSQPASQRYIPYGDAQRLFDELRADLIPAELRGRPPIARKVAWPRWVVAHDAAIRARLLRGYEDSIVNLLFFGTRFTQRPRLTSGDIRAQAGGRTALLDARLHDLVAAIVMPGANGRLLFVRSMMERHGADPATPQGRRAARAYIGSLVDRFVADRARYERAFRRAKDAADPSVALFTQSTMYRDRGLSSDTSIFPDYAIDVTLRDLESAGLLAPDSVHRVGIVGPGLDFADKDEGYDFYPQQTLQPFAVMDSLLRLGLGAAGDLHTTTFDVNPRVTEHLQAARLRAEAGEPYVLEFARNARETWLRPLIDYWEQTGRAIGDPAASAAPPANAGPVAVRSVRVAPARVLSVTARDLNIVVQRVEPPADQRFDLIVATNILVYYDVFEQSLALANISRMLRPGGVFLTNHVVLSSPSMMVAGSTDVPYTTAGDGDRIWWFQRQ